MNPKAGKLRELIEAGEHFIAAEAYSALTGRIVQAEGFQAAYLGGHACSAFHYAIPDNGIYSQVEQIEQAARIADVMDIPLIADADTLGEMVADAFHFTRRYIRAGIAGIHVEDEVNPKHSRHANGLYPIEDMQLRIEASVKAREGNGDIVIIARCDELYGKDRGGGGDMSVEEAIKRGKAYAEAGADMLVFPIASPEAHAEIIPQMPIPVCTLGFNLPDTICTLSTGWGWVGAAKLHQQRARELKETGMIALDMADFVLEGKQELIQQDFYDQLVFDWADKTGRATRDKGAP